MRLYLNGLVINFTTKTCTTEYHMHNRGAVGSLSHTDMLLMFFALIKDGIATALEKQQWIPFSTLKRYYAKYAVLRRGGSFVDK